jgi:hypothetical protein
VCRGQEHLKPVWYPTVEGGEKSKERAQSRRLSRCVSGRQLLIAREARRVQQRRLRPQADCNVQYNKFTT